MAATHANVTREMEDAGVGEAFNLLTSPDPILSALPKRPEFAEIDHLYERAESAFWTVHEIDFSQDRAHWDALTPPERQFISWILAFFSASDIIVNNNLGENFLREFLPFSIRRLLAFQMMIENTHSMTYATNIEELIPDPAEKLRLLDALSTFPPIQRKAAWCERWTDPATATLGERLVAWACVEGIFFSGSFCALFWLKKRNLMPGTTFANELISRDEGLHRDTSIALYRLLPAGDKVSYARLLEIVVSAVDFEKAFIGEAMPEGLTGMNAGLMGQYIEFVADHLITSLGFAAHYGTPNPFPWMDLISLEGKTNFFERRVGEYSRSTVPGNEVGEIDLRDEDF